MPRPKQGALLPRPNPDANPLTSLRQVTLRQFRDGSYEVVAQIMDLGTRRLVAVAGGKHTSGCDHEHCAWARIGDLAAEMFGRAVEVQLSESGGEPPF